MPERGATLPARLGPATARVGIIGWPVDHSISPRLHNAVHARLAVDAHYHRLAVPPSQLAATVRAMAALGWRGANVTIPHKVEVLRSCDRVSDEARSIGAANVLTFEAGTVHGDNTDARGWLTSLREETDFADGSPAVVFGTGGAARAVVAALVRASAGITVVGRRAEAVADLVGLAGPTARGVLVGDVPAVAAAVRSSVLVVNATPLGLNGEPLPEALQELTAGQIASDLVHRAGTTPFLAAAAATGAAVHPGLGMLLGQAALSFSAWHGGEPPPADFRAAMATG